MSSARIHQSSPRPSTAMRCDRPVVVQLSSTARQVRVAVAREVGADVRDAGGAERADRVRRRAARDLLVAQLLVAARPAGRQRSIRSHTRWAPSRREMPTCPRDPHQVEHAGDVAARSSSRRRLPRDAWRGPRCRARAAGPPRSAARGCARGTRASPSHQRPSACASAALAARIAIAVDRQVLAEHVGRLVRPVLEQRALLVRELLEDASRRTRRGARRARAGGCARRPRSGRAAGSAARGRCRAVGGRRLARGAGPASRWLRIASRRTACGVVA